MCLLTNPQCGLFFHVPQMTMSSPDPGDSGGMEERGGLSAWWPAALRSQGLILSLSLLAYQQDMAWTFSSPGFPKHKMQSFVWTALGWALDRTIFNFLSLDENVLQPIKI